MPLMPMPPMPTKWIGADVERQRPHAACSRVSGMAVAGAVRRRDRRARARRRGGLARAAAAAARGKPLGRGHQRRERLGERRRR